MEQLSRGESHYTVRYLSVRDLHSGPCIGILLADILAH